MGNDFVIEYCGKITYSLICVMRCRDGAPPSSLSTLPSPIKSTMSEWYTFVAHAAVGSYKVLDGAFNSRL